MWKIWLQQESAMPWIYALSEIAFFIALPLILNCEILIIIFAKCQKIVGSIYYLSRWFQSDYKIFLRRKPPFSVQNSFFKWFNVNAGYEAQNGNFNISIYLFKWELRNSICCGGVPELRSELFNLNRYIIVWNFLFWGQLTSSTSLVEHGVFSNREWEPRRQPQRRERPATESAVRHTRHKNGARSRQYCPG